MSRILSLISQKCPQCEAENIYENSHLFSFGKMHDNCPNCNCQFEIEPGFFYGAMYVTYGLTVAEAVGSYVIAQFFLESLTALLAVIFTTLIALSPVNYKFSRVIWMYFFISNKKA